MSQYDQSFETPIEMQKCMSKPFRIIYTWRVLFYYFDEYIKINSNTFALHEASGAIFFRCEKGML
jgi:hypothetical protein